MNLRMSESSGEVGWSAVELLSTGEEYWEVLLG